MPVTPLAVSQMGIRRRNNFQGINDKYMPWRTVAKPNVVEAVRSEAGFIDIASDPAMMNEMYRDVARERMKRYQNYNRFFEGRHYEHEYDDGEKKPVYNFCQLVVNKAVDFFVAEGFEIVSVAGNELVAQAFDMVWKANDKKNLFRRLALNCAIAGDAFLYITLKTLDDAGQELPKAQWKIVLTALDPFFVFPLFNKTNPQVMDACLIQYPTGKSATGGVTYESLYLTPTKCDVYVDSTLKSSNPNPFGVVPVVHFPNQQDPLKTWGPSDLAAIVPLNEEYNLIAASIRKIIKYHAEPTTVIFGARASKLEKGAKKVWSGLPVDARVENLAYNADLAAVYAYLNNIENTIYKVGCIPSVMFQLHGDGGMSVSNTSGLAMQMMYQPLIDKVNRKKESFTTSFKRSCEIIGKAFEVLGTDLEELADDPEHLLEMSPEFSDPLPFDEVAAMDADTKKLAVGVTSQAALLRKYNPGEDTQRLTIEILADRVSTMLMENEKARMLQGHAPNLTSLLSSSIAISEDIASMGKSVADASSSLADTAAAEQKAAAEEAAKVAAANKPAPKPTLK
jgi:hypothetical protein